MIISWLPDWLSADLSLISGFLTWIIVLAWLWKSGWKIQRRYFIEATQKPLTRNAIVWSAGIVGAIFFVAAQMRPGMPGVMTVAMIGALSAYVDARTHRLPNAYRCRPRRDRRRCDFASLATKAGGLAGRRTHLVRSCGSPQSPARWYGWWRRQARPGARRDGRLSVLARNGFRARAVLRVGGCCRTVEDRCWICGNEDARADGSVDDRIGACRHHRMGCCARLAVGPSVGLIVDPPGRVPVRMGQ